MSGHDATADTESVEVTSPLFGIRNALSRADAVRAESADLLHRIEEHQRTLRR